ncbi:MAG: hypothetical protein AAGC66_10740 [Leifsonia sp.]
MLTEALQQPGGSRIIREEYGRNVSGVNDRESLGLPKVLVRLVAGT